jgi:hypothetical protein
MFPEQLQDQDEIEYLRQRFQEERERRLKADPDLVHATVRAVREFRRLTAIAEDEKQPPEIRLDAAKRSLDLAGVTARSARFRECDPADLTLAELHNVIERIDGKFDMAAELGFVSRSIH